MKLRTLITLLFVSLMFTTVTAQKAKKFEVGFQGGYGSQWIINQNNYGLPEMDYDYHWGGGWNIQGGYNFTEDMGVFTEVGMLQQGQKYKDTWENNADVKRNIDMKYLNIPVFFKYTAGTGNVRFRVLVGPQFCLLQKAEQQYTINDVNVSDIPYYQEYEMSNGKVINVGQEDITERYNSLDIAAVIDLGADFFVMKDMLYISAGIRMSYGLTDINASDYEVKNFDGNYDPSHNAGGTFLLGAHYIIGGKSE